MSEWANLSVLLIAAHALINIVASVFIVRTDSHHGAQIVAKMFILWMIPVVGILFIFAIGMWPKAANESELSCVEPP